MRGRKPTPTKLRELRGNPGHRPLNGEEPQPAPAIPDAPDFLGTEALAEWQRLTVELHAVGLLSQLDRGALAAYCIAWGNFVLGQRMVRKLGVMLRSKQSKMLYVNPYQYLANKAMEQLTRLGPLFGLDPSSRSRMHVAPPAEKDWLQKLLEDDTGDTDHAGDSV